MAGLVLAGIVAGAVNVDAASITASWNAPTTNANGTALTDLAGYRVYIGTTQQACPGASFLTAPSSTAQPAAGQVVSHRIAGLNAGTTYVLQVTAVDSTGNESACSPTASGVARPDFSVTPTTSTSFGSVPTGSTVDRTFTVQNVGTTSLSGGASVGAPFSIASGATFSLAPGASHTVAVRFQPTTTGSFAGNVSFTAGGETISRGVSGSTTTGSGLTLSVTRNGTGSGTVTSSPAGIACGNDCAEAVAVGTRVSLSAAPASGSVFAGWGGACSGTAACTVTVNAATAVTATFNSSTQSAPASTVSASPTSPNVRQVAADSSGVTFAVTWGAVSGAASYRWGAAFNDGSAGQQGTVTAPSLQLRMPYHASGVAASGFVCVASVTAAGRQSAEYACSPLPVPARPATTSPALAPVVGSLSPAQTQAGGAGFTLTVSGSRFVTSSVVHWNGAPRPTTFVSATQLRAAIAASDIATVRSIPVTVVTPAPGGGTSGQITFTVTQAPASTFVPGAPGSPTVRQLTADATGVTFAVSWGAVSGAASYRYGAAFSDGSAAQQGTVTGLLSVQLRMPYHSSGRAFDAFVCLLSISATGQQSADYSCSRIRVPAPR